MMTDMSSGDCITGRCLHLWMILNTDAKREYGKILLVCQLTSIRIVRPMTFRQAGTDVSGHRTKLVTTVMMKMGRLRLSKVWQLKSLPQGSNTECMCSFVCDSYRLCLSHMSYISK